MLRGEINRIDIDYTFTPDIIEGVEFTGDAHAVGEITDCAGYMRLSLRVSVKYRAECARCLASVERTFESVFERTVAAEGTLSDEKLREDADEYVVIENGKLDIDEQLRETLILEFPIKILCSEDCPGLCQICGKRLAEGDCGCKRKEADPRLAILKTLLKKEDGASENSEKD